MCQRMAGGSTLQALAVLGALAVVCVLGALQLFVRVEPFNGSPKRYLKQMVVKRAVNHSPSNPAAKAPAPAPSPSPSPAPAPAPVPVVTATAFENNTKTHKKKPDVYFILDSANSVRKKHVQDMTNLLNSFDVHIWHSVPAETVGERKYAALTSKKTFANVRRGAIGCALAHITLLQHISNQDAESALVFESDAELSNTFEQDFSQFVQHLPQNFEFGQLMHHKHMKKLRKSAKTINKHVMDSYAPYGTVGYYIMRSALKKLLPALIPITQPIDEMFRKVIKNRVVRSYMPKKDLITMPYKFDSTIWKTKIQAASKVLSEPKTDSPLKYSVPCNMFPDRWKTHGDEMVKILEMFHTILEKLGIDYSLIGGSLLAYSRNNGQPMPWDDDLDVFIMPKNAPRVKAAIEASKDYCHASLWLGFKMFRCDSPRIGKYAWRYPMIDVFTTSKYAKLAAYLFPSQLATFAGIAIRIPKDPVGLTIDTYGKNSLETCKSSSWNHKMEKSFTKSVGFPCKDVMAQCHGKPTTPQKTDKTDEYEWQKNIDVDKDVCKNKPSGARWIPFTSMVNVLNKLNANYTISTGTVLSWYRDCSLGSSDVDMNIDLDWFKKNQDRLRKALLASGWRQKYTFGTFGDVGYEESWTKNGVKTDLFSVAYVDGRYINGLTIAGKVYPCNQFLERYETHTWNGISFQVPAPIEPYLRGLYGNWRKKHIHNYVWDVEPFKTDNGRRFCYRDVDEMKKLQLKYKNSLALVNATG